MTCGDAQDQIVDPVNGSVWSGTFGTDDVMVAFLPAANAAMLVINSTVFVGQWRYINDGDELSFGFTCRAGENTWLAGGSSFTCSGEDVTAMNIDATLQGAGPVNVTTVAVTLSRLV